MRVYKDAFYNTAVIEEVEIFPYEGANRKKKSYRLILRNEEGFVYHVSVHETNKEAVDRLECLSCGTFVEIENGGGIEK